MSGLEGMLKHGSGTWLPRTSRPLLLCGWLFQTTLKPLIVESDSAVVVEMVNKGLDECIL